MPSTRPRARRLSQAVALHLLPLLLATAPAAQAGAPVCGNDLMDEPVAVAAGEEVAPRIFARGFACAAPDVRESAARLAPVRVRYRLHLCRNALGVDAFTPDEVRATMEGAAAGFAEAGIVLEEEALVRFDEDDCDVLLGDKTWSAPLEESTPAGVLAFTFVAAISHPTGGFTVGGFCGFGGPLCVAAGTDPSLAVHELGHFFGLAHTFECANGVETEDNCETAGDLLCDTPPDRGPKSVKSIARCQGGALLDGSCSGSCSNKTCTDGSKPDAYNWMSFYDCSPGHFSQGQLDFVRCTMGHELVGFDADGPSSTTTSSTTTSSTLEDTSTCGDYNDDGGVSATDALAVLRAVVDGGACPASRCDWDGSGSVTASDALAVLLAAIGAGSTPACP